MEPTDMAARLRAFYDAHNPGNQQNIAEIVRKYRGKEAALCAKLRKKYGVAPDLLPPPPSSAARGPAEDETKEEKKKRNPSAAPYDRHYVVVCAPPLTAARDAALDFRSPAFDALKALRAHAAAPPVTALTPLDNIHKCRHLLPSTDPNHQKLVPIVAKKAVSTATSKQGNDAAKPVAPAQRVPVLFETLADTYLDGPFTVLRRCFLERRRVRVVVRRVNSVRGACSGFLKAFDKHMNMVLLDVREQWIPHAQYAAHDRAKREAGGRHDPATLFSVADEARNRGFTAKGSAKQLFVRGDNVVMVMEDATFTPSASSGGSSSERSRSYAPRR